MNSEPAPKSNQQTEAERHSGSGTHLVSIDEDNVKPTGVDDDSMGEEGSGEDYLGRSHKRRDEG